MAALLKNLFGGQPIGPRRTVPTITNTPSPIGPSRPVPPLVMPGVTPYNGGLINSLKKRTPMGQ